ncbi:hypothetical protein IFR05_008131 [Cadophora sp. M221]|nr:hypothetical protein IFR05_008131 [Cadophora sp. M221]
MERMAVPVLKRRGKIRDMTHSEDEDLYEEAKPMTATDQSQTDKTSHHHKQSHRSSHSQKQSQAKGSNGKQQENFEPSAASPSNFQSPQKRRREEKEREWKAKEERDISGGERVPGGYEDVKEMEKLRSLDGLSQLCRVRSFKITSADSDEED